ncbi:hypothetical protein L2E82_31901 [Cichorium intybus]|uniref:Uncharacterized protein n=1 Tax=Cichorium intybus TaxID=13427 RepID=A0ACB9BEU0_CICIN|nr:hypothetical protein L2E82_31901 [Cichorium intybus]
MRNSILQSKRNDPDIISDAKKKVEGVIVNAAITTGVLLGSESLNGEDGGISMESVMAEGMVVDEYLSDCNDGENVEVVGFVGIEVKYRDPMMIVSSPPVCCLSP